MSSYQILLVDDDEDEFITIRDLFSDVVGAEYSLTWASSYEQGLEALRKKKFDVCLLDHQLGARTGLDFLEEISPLELRCPIILLTGRSDIDLDLQAMRMGAADYIEKGQLTSLLLERTVRYTIKHASDLQELKENRLQIVQQDRLASLGLLASSLAHEIGTPLGIIRSRAELVKRRLSKSGDASDLEVIVGQIDRITKLVNSLLNLARSRNSSVSGPVDTSLVIEDVANLIKHELSQKRIELKFDPTKKIFALAERGPLGQILLNLVVNAIHAIEEAQKAGRSSDHYISINVRENAVVHITVSDTGCGILEENLPQLFKPFFTTKDIGVGTGLGLATSYKIAQSWGGSISVQSDFGKGSKFTVTLQKAEPST